MKIGNVYRIEKGALVGIPDNLLGRTSLGRVSNPSWEGKAIKIDGEFVLLEGMQRV